MPYTKHIAGEMGEDLIQYCVICGEEVANYQKTMYPAGSPPPSGWAPGELYISDQGNPKIFTTIEPEGETITNCNQK